MKAQVQKMQVQTCPAFDHEKFVLMHSGCFSKIFNGNMDKVDPECLEGLVKIQHKCRTVYRRYRGSKVDGNVVELGYRTQKELKVKDGDEVVIKPTNWFCYLWHNQDSCIKHPFRIAFVGIILTLISFLLTLLGLMVSTISLMQSLIDRCCC